MTEAETETTETPEEHVENPAAVLKKNRELLADLKNTKERTAALEELARDFGLDDAALADPRAHIAKRAETTKAADHRARVVKEAVLTRLIDEGRIVPKGGTDEVVKKVLADPSVKVDGDQIVGLDSILSAIPRQASPVPPNLRHPYSDPVPKTLEELQAKGPGAVQAFAQRSPTVYQSLREDFQRRLAKGERTR